MKKHSHLIFTETIFYLQLVKNTIDMDLAQKLMQGDLRKIDSDAQHNWLLYRKVSWELYLKKKFKNRKEEF